MAQAMIEGLLTREEGGVWFVPGEIDAKAVEASARRKKLAFFHVDGRNVQRKEQLMTALATALRLPAHFGQNWDALEECLIDLEPVDGPGYLLLYDHIDGLMQSHPDQFETLVEILRDAVASWQEDDTVMTVVLAGAKAPKGVAKARA
jgi:RNAse (barnase) inhibitor barstar